MSTDEPIGSIVIENVFTVKGDALAADAAMLMVNKRISCLPVSMGEGAIGIITEKDIIAKVVATGRDPKKVKIKEIMSSPLILAPMDATIREAAREDAQTSSQTSGHNRRNWKADGTRDNDRYRQVDCGEAG